MAQISKGDTFTDGQQVTGARLNQLVDSSVLLVGAITDQPSITANTLQATDTTIVNDAGVLKEATIGDFLNSNLPISTSAITGGTGVDLVLTPAAGQKVDVAGNIEADDINVTDDLTVGDDATISGDLVVTGGSTLTGNVVADNGFTSNGVANFTGTLQVNGTVGYVLTEISEESIASWTAPSTGNHFSIFTSAAFTKPAGEIWAFEIVYNWTGTIGAGGVSVAGRYGSVTQGTGAYLFHDVFFDSQGGANVYRNTITQRWIALSGTTFTSETFKVDANASAGTSLQVFNTTTSVLTTSVTSSKFRIYKYKTA
jgi:hypothetical protein